MIGDPDHPLWRLLRLIVLVGSLTLLLYSQASQFDQTELTVIGAMFVILGLDQGAMTVISRYMKGK